MIPVKVQTRLMGNTFEFIALAPNEEIGHEQIAVGVEEIKRIEKVFTTFSDNSVTNEVNRMAGVSPVEVPEEFFWLVFRAQKISALTQGLFDLSYGSLDKDFWNFNRAIDSAPSPR